MVILLISPQKSEGKHTRTTSHFDIPIRQNEGKIDT
jgi:hypothetical protein